MNRFQIEAANRIWEEIETLGIVLAEAEANPLSPTSEKEGIQRDLDELFVEVDLLEQPIVA